MRRFDRVLVCGGSGFLGTVLVARLASAGYRVTVADRHDLEPSLPGVSSHAVDLEDAAATTAFLAPWRWDAVVNLAGRVTKEIEAWDEGVITAASHVRIAANLRLALPEGWQGRFVQVSGMVVYGMPVQVPVPEEHPLQPIHAYGLAKKLAEDVVLAGPPVDCWVLRLAGLFSEARRGGALYGFVRAAHEGRTLDVTAPRPLPWDAIHVDDAVSGIVGALESAATGPGAVNVSYGEPMDLVDVARRIARRSDRPVTVRSSVEQPSFCLSTEKARQLFTWPPSSLDARLEQLWCAWATVVV
jgi:UDP-glucose 4-epimerase